MKASIRVFLRIDNHHKGVDAGCKTISNLSVARLDRVNIGQVDDDSVARQGLGRLDPACYAQPPEQVLGFTPARQYGACLVRRGAPNTRGDDLSPTQRIHERRLAGARPAEHSDDAPRRIDLAAFSGNVDQLANPGQRRLVDIRGRQRAHLVKFGSRRRDRALRTPHARTSRAFANA